MPIAILLGATSWQGVRMLWLMLMDGFGNPAPPPLCSGFYMYKLLYVALNFVPMLVFGDPEFAPVRRCMSFLPVATRSAMLLGRHSSIEWTMGPSGLCRPARTVCLSGPARYSRRMGHTEVGHRTGRNLLAVPSLVGLAGARKPPITKRYLYNNHAIATSHSCLNTLFNCYCT